jgi:hypothetical protein
MWPNGLFTLFLNIPLNTIKILLTGLFLTGSALGVTGQSNYQRIALFSRVWGFLKYYHPAVAFGKCNWDSVFTAQVMKAADAKTNAGYNRELLAMLDAAGKIEKTGTPPAIAADSICTYNYSGIRRITGSKLLNSRVRERLGFIYENPNRGENRYIKIVHQTADFSAEKQYENIGFPNTAFRLLFLARFWNIINYFAPYKYLSGNWNDVLEKFIPRIIHSSDSLSYYKTLLELAKALHDGHSGVSLSGHPDLIQHAVFGAYTMPFYYEIFGGKVIVRDTGNDPVSKSSDIRRGDIILKINDEDVRERILKRRKYISASNQADEDHWLGWWLLDGQTPSANLTIQRGNRIYNTRVTRILDSKRNWQLQTNYTYGDAGYKKPDDSTLLIYAAQIWDGNLDTLKTMIRQAKAVIFDVRNYPQNDAFFYITGPFLKRPAVINYSTVAMPAAPGMFRWVPSPEIGHVNNHPFAGRVVILADERTQSQGEYSCMVLQTIPGAITIGRATAGTDGVKTSIPMGGELTISYSGYGIYYPDKRQTQRTGIKIDIPVKNSMEAIAKGQDPILAEALKYVRSPGANYKTGD